MIYIGLYRRSILDVADLEIRNMIKLNVKTKVKNYDRVMNDHKYF